MPHILQVLERDGETWRSLWQRELAIPMEWALHYLDEGHPAIRLLDGDGKEVDRISRADSQKIKGDYEAERPAIAVSREVDKLP